MKLNRSVALVVLVLVLAAWLGIRLGYRVSTPESHLIRTEVSSAKSTPVAPQAGFATMDLKEVAAQLAELRKQDLFVIFRAMLDAGRVDHDLTKQLSIQTAFSFALRERVPTQEILRELRGFVQDPTNSTFERGLVLGVLGVARTEPCGELLLDLAPTLREPELRRIAFSGISLFGAEGSRLEGVSPTLERLWHQSEDRELLAALAQAMAQVGTTTSMEVLVRAASDQRAAGQERHTIALRTLRGVTIQNPRAVAPLVAVLRAHPPGSDLGRLAGDALARMVEPSGSRAVLAWLQQTDDHAAALAYEYAVSVRAPTQLKVWESAMEPGVSFRSEKVREAIRTGLIEYRNRRGY